MRGHSLWWQVNIINFEVAKVAIWPINPSCFVHLSAASRALSRISVTLSNTILQETMILPFRRHGAMILWTKMHRLSFISWNVMLQDTDRQTDRQHTSQPADRLTDSQLQTVSVVFWNASLLVLIIVNSLNQKILLILNISNNAWPMLQTDTLLFTCAARRHRHVVLIYHNVICSIGMQTEGWNRTSAFPAIPTALMRLR